MRPFNINNKLLIGIPIAALIIYLGIKVSTTVKEMRGQMLESLPQTFALPEEDSVIFTNEARKTMNVEIVYNHKFRKPISFLSAENKYSIIVFQTNYSDTIPINLMLKKKGNLDRSVGVTYNVISRDGFTFQHKAGKLFPANKIIVSFDGEYLTQTSDSIGTNLFGCFEKGAIKYDEDEPQDIFIQSNRGKRCWEILLIKKFDKVYCLLASPNDPKEVMKSDFLYSLISTSNNNYLSNLAIKIKCGSIY